MLKLTYKKNAVRQSVMSLSLMFFSIIGQAQNAVPTNLQASVEGDKVTLQWDRAVQGKCIASQDFEGASFPCDGWSVKTTNSSDYRCSWFPYPTDDFKELDNWADFIFHGDKSAMVYMDMGSHSDGSAATQDEWLMSPELNGAAFVEFYSYIDPMIREYGVYEDFPDHYYVKASYDGGTTWQVLWDARYDCSPLGGWQQVVLPLNSSASSAIIAFEAVGDQTNPSASLYFAWAIDDVRIYDASSETTAKAHNIISMNKNMPTANKGMRRSFNNGKAPGHTMSLSPESSVSFYRVYLDDVLVADSIKALTYTDISAKSIGSHTYKVTYYDVDTKTESAPAQTAVNIEEQAVNAPQQVTACAEWDEENQSYTAVIKWTKPEGDRQPAYYTVYCNDIMIGTEITDMELGQTDMTRGVYRYDVQACYKYPEGESSLVGDEIAILTKYPARNVEALLDGNDVNITWHAPKASDSQLSHYLVYRGNMLIASLTDMSYTDTDVPDGLFSYSVIAVYSDGSQAMARSRNVSKGDIKAAALPFSEKFDGQQTPANWSVLKHYDDTDNMYLWRFDNWFEQPISGGGFEGNFASVDGLGAGFAYIMSSLNTPPVNTEMTGGDELAVDFDMDYMTEGDAEATLEYSTDRGDTWNIVATLQGYSQYSLAVGETCKPTKEKYFINGIEYGNDIMLRWNYTGMLDGHLAIDNIKITNSNNSGITDITDKDNVTLSVAAGRVTAKANHYCIESMQMLTLDGKSVFMHNGLSKHVTSPALAPGLYIINIQSNGHTSISKLSVK